MNEYQRLAADFHDRDESEERCRIEDDWHDYLRDMEREGLTEADANRGEGLTLAKIYKAHEVCQGAQDD